MDSSKDPAYPRVRIFGRLICKSALHVGDGDALALKNRRDCTKKPKKGDSDYNSDYSSVCIAGNGQPYLPASTLRGFLRGVAKRADAAHRSAGEPLTPRLFGYAEKNATGGTARYGAVRVYDAFLTAFPPHKTLPGYWSPVRATNIRHGIAIHPITGTTEEHKLFSYEYLPAGSVFDVELEGDDLTEAELGQVLGLLSCWDGGAAAAIGKGTSRGQGRLKWCLDRVEVLGGTDLERWLQEDLPLGKYFQVLKSPPAPSSAARLQLRSARLCITPTSPLLANDPSYVTGEEGEPDHEYSRLPDGRPLIPAASLRGLIRARARRILATIAVDLGIAPEVAGAKVDGLVQSLFGKTGQRSPLWVSDGVASGGQPHPQMFNAIDRFTGGVEGTKLYQVNGVIPMPVQVELHLEQECEPVGDWWKGLLILVLRDAIEGDLTIGWGKARGYGAVKVALEWDGMLIDSWRGFLAYLGNKSLRNLVESWIKKLHDKVGELAQTGNEGAAPQAARR